MFKNNTEFCIHLEKLKQEHQFDTFIETIGWFIENESDQEPEQIARLLNKKILENIEVEARNLNMLKSNSPTIELFA